MSWVIKEDEVGAVGYLKYDGISCHDENGGPLWHWTPEIDEAFVYGSAEQAYDKIDEIGAHHPAYNMTLVPLFDDEPEEQEVESCPVSDYDRAMGVLA